MKKFYETIWAELTEFDADEVIMASPASGSGENELGNSDDLIGVGGML